MILDSSFNTLAAPRLGAAFDRLLIENETIQQIPSSGGQPFPAKGV
jgi:hypothetical protein